MKKMKYTEKQAVERIFALMREYGAVSVAKLMLGDGEDFVLLTPVFAVVGDVMVVPVVVRDNSLYDAITAFSLRDLLKNSSCQNKVC